MANQTVRIVATFAAKEQATEWAQQHPSFSFAGVVVHAVEVVGNILYIIIEAAGDLILPTFGKIKDDLPWRVSRDCSYGPI